ncbi:MAG TPA: LLM class flavin-dependent oxidoreductase [Candidatus Binataceae bacterium]|nr:LLM class flavin-dependent oxidoreductase [Candidatus Binataceae bacterium]
MAQVRFGYQVDFRNPPASGRSFSDLYAEMFRQVERAEEIGFDSIWLTEHHLTDDGYLPSLMPMAAAIAARTKRVQIGTYVLLFPFYHPIKLAEDIAVVDLISGGRLRIGVGQAYRAEEFAAFGINKKHRLGRTLEIVEILKLAWTGERFSFKGKYFDLSDVRVLPRPASQPHPELLWGVGAPKGIQRAAALGMGFATVGAAGAIRIYHEALQAGGKDPGKFSVVGSRTVYVADSAERAWSDIEGPSMYWAEHYGRWLSQHAGTDISKAPIRPDPERLRRTSVLGPPAEVRRRLAQIIEEDKLTDLVINTQLPGLDPALAMRSLERFGSEVLPFLK